MTDDDPEEYGTIHTLTAIKADTRLLLSHHEGGRTVEDAIALFSNVEKKRSLNSPSPVFTSEFEIG